MKTKAGFALPLQLPLVERLRNTLPTRGLPLDKYSWLPQAMLSAGCLPDDEDAFETLRQLFVSAFTHWTRLDDRDGTVLAILEAIDGHMSRAVWLHEPSSSREQWPITPEARAKFIQACLANGVDFTNSLVSATTSDPAVSVTTDNRARLALQTARMLGRDKLLVPERLCDVGRLKSLAQVVGWGGGNFNGGEIEAECADVTSPTFWIVIGANDFWRCLEPRLGSADDEGAAKLTEGAVATINRLSRIMAPLYDHEQGLEILARLFRELDRRVGPEPKKANRNLRHVWMRLSLELKRGWITHLDESTKNRLRAAADYELGYARRAIREAEGAAAEQWLNEALPPIDAATNILVQLLPLWDTIRPLLLILRELKVPAVAPDMRYWSDGWHTPDAPRPWNHIPETLVSLFHAIVREEQQKDEKLNDLRGRFAQFCLERLKPKEAGGPPVEPDPRWRWAYLRAVRELMVNPEGNGQHILHHVSKSDPDPDVKAEAGEVYVQMRHSPKLPKGLSPRRTVTEALVWLFQAHFLTVSPEGTLINPHDVQRTREEIARRTSEPRWETKEAGAPRSAP